MIHVLKRHPRFLAFRVLQIFFTAPGQTFFISLFVQNMFESLALPISTFAGLYALATLLASLLLNPAGRLIDYFDPKIIITCITILMALGCLCLAFTQSVLMLFIGFFIVRLIGQGVFVLTSSTLINRHFHQNRGKAHSFVSLGYPLSELIYPSLAVFLLGLLGWRMSYVIFACSTLFIMLPIQWFLLHQSQLKKGQFLKGEILIQAQRPPGKVYSPQTNNALLPEAKVSDVIKDLYFYPILLASAVPPVLVSGLFFFQQQVFDFHQWSISLAPLGFACYAIVKAVFSLGIGSFTDKKGPIGPFFCIVFLIALGTLIASLGGPSFICIPLYFSCLGASLGMSAVVMNIIWVRLYGVKHIGSIKGFIGTFRNGFTGFAPFFMALFLEKGLPIHHQFLIMSFFVFLMALIPFIVAKKDPRL